MENAGKEVRGKQSFTMAFKRAYVTPIVFRRQTNLALNLIFSIQTKKCGDDKTTIDKFPRYLQIACEN